MRFPYVVEFSYTYTSETEEQVVSMISNVIP